MPVERDYSMEGTTVHAYELEIVSMSIGQVKGEKKFILEVVGIKGTTANVQFGVVDLMRIKEFAERAIAHFPEFALIED